MPCTPSSAITSPAWALKCIYPIISRPMAINQAIRSRGCVVVWLSHNRLAERCLSCQVVYCCGTFNCRTNARINLFPFDNAAVFPILGDVYIVRLQLPQDIIFIVSCLHVWRDYCWLLYCTSSFVLIFHLYFVLTFAGYCVY